MRAFIAIELPKDVKNALFLLQQKLKNAGADAKWVSPGNIHLTLKFLGEIDEQQLEGVKKIIAHTAADNKAFSARLCCLGAFPKISAPRVIWVGIDIGDIEIKKIAEALEDELAKMAVPPEERPFSSHITIGRIRSGLNRNHLVWELEKLAGAFKDECLKFDVSKLTLFKSTLSPKGPTYEILEEANLKTI